MKVIKSIFLMIAITLALTLFLTTKNIDDEGSPEQGFHTSEPVSIKIEPLPEKRVSRFLQERGRGNGRPADHCHKNEEICDYIMEGRNTTCCNNKCVDLAEDANNCGRCKNKCLPTLSCCRGECVNLALDKRHCGACGNRCMPGGYCFYGICDYA